MTEAWQGFLAWREADVWHAKLEAGDVRLATNLVLRWSAKLRLPDAIHLALASRLRVPLVTLDRRLIEAARALAIEAITF